MAIKHIEIQNFKSFRHQKIELGQFNVLIGGNASGKSNFLQIFKFLSDIAHHGLNNAIFRQGGVEYLKNTDIGAETPLVLKMVIDSNYLDEGLIAKEATLVPEITYEFALRFDQPGRGFEVIADKLTYQPKNEKGQFAIIHLNEKVKTENTLGDSIPAFVQQSLLNKTLKPQTLLLEQPLFRGIVAEFNQIDIFRHIFIYDFDAKQSKKISSMAGKLDLEEDTSNLAIVLKNLLADQEKTRLFFNMLTHVLPFVEDIRVDPVAEQYLSIKLKEAYSKVYLPTAFISDGTINAISLIIALYCEEQPLILIEEPDKNIYPYLIEGIIELFQEVSENKQIIITTHSSQIVKYTGSENLLFISRDKDGFSTISRPLVENQDVKIFLQNLEVEYLYTQDLLGL
jgi:predicted ATPase